MQRRFQRIDSPRPAVTQEEDDLKTVFFLSDSEEPLPGQSADDNIQLPASLRSGNTAPQPNDLDPDTQKLREEIRAQAGEAWDAVANRAVFANTAVDRIVPAQAPGAGVDVTVEPFFEWAIERGPFGDDLPNIPGAHFVDDLAPYIERKLFTVNTGHATTAYFGAQAGTPTVAEALAVPEIAASVSAAPVAARPDAAAATSATSTTPHCPRSRSR